jgi:GxxExxY protein
MAERSEVPDWVNRLSERVIGCAIEVQRTLGPGLLEAVYEAALCYELRQIDLRYAQQVSFFGGYKGIALPMQRFDLVIEDTIIVELKAVRAVEDMHLAQLVSYIKLANKPLGLLINFNAPTIARGTYRRVNSACKPLSNPSAASATSAPSAYKSECTDDDQQGERT